MVVVLSSLTPTKGGDLSMVTSNWSKHSTRVNYVSCRHTVLSTPALVVCERQDKFPTMHAVEVTTTHIASVGIRKNSVVVSVDAAEKSVGRC